MVTQKSRQKERHESLTNTHKSTQKTRKTSPKYSPTRKANKRNPNEIPYSKKYICQVESYIQPHKTEHILKQKHSPRRSITKSILLPICMMMAHIANRICMSPLASTRATWTVLRKIATTSAQWRTNSHNSSDMTHKGTSPFRIHWNKMQEN